LLGDFIVADRNSVIKILFFIRVDNK
jgi:hypothetical protein